MIKGFSRPLGQSSAVFKHLISLLCSIVSVRFRCYTELLLQTVLLHSHSAVKYLMYECHCIRLETKWLLQTQDARPFLSNYLYLFEQIAFHHYQIVQM